MNSVIHRTNSTRKGKICRVENCEKRVDEGGGALGFCRSHYQRHYQGRPLDTPLAVTGKNKGKRCSVEDCFRRADELGAARGLCRWHYRRLMAGQVVDAPKRKSNKGKQCRVECCERDAHCRLLCRSHYNMRQKRKKNKKKTKKKRSKLKPI